MSSLIKQEIVKNMSSWEVNGNQEVSASFVFPFEFVGFKGHFPDKKILPGICQIQSVLVMIEKWKNADVALREIKQVKFLSPVFPMEEITCECKEIKSTEDGIVLKASIKGSDKAVATLKLRVSVG